MLHILSAVLRQVLSCQHSQQLFNLEFQFLSYSVKNTQNLEHSNLKKRNLLKKTCWTLHGKLMRPKKELEKTTTAIKQEETLQLIVTKKSEKWWNGWFMIELTFGGCLWHPRETCPSTYVKEYLLYNQKVNPVSIKIRYVESYLFLKQSEPMFPSDYANVSENEKFSNCPTKLTQILSH
jgi:hypothetical protein